MTGEVLKKNWEEMQQEGYLVKLGIPKEWVEDVNKVVAIDELASRSQFQRRTALETSIKLDRSMDVAVIGCGYGLDEEWIFPQVKSIKGCDISGTAVGIANKRFANISSVSFEEVNGKDLFGFKEGKYDLVYSVTVFQHIPRELARKYFEEFARILRTGGKTFIQFLSGPGFNDQDAGLEKKEPSVGYSFEQLEELVRYLPFKKISLNIENIEPKCDWIWAVYEKI